VNVPQLYADLDRTRARQLGVAVTEVFDTMQIYLGSLYVNDFNKFGRTYSVRVQADAPYRARAEDVGQLKVRSNTGRDGAALGADERAPGGRAPSARSATTASSRPTSAAATRPAFRPGRRRTRSSASPPRPCRRDRLRVDRDHLPGDPRRQLGIWVYPLAILLVFLVLAALYESLALPIAIILIVPLSLGAALTGVWLTHGDNNIFTQIGFMVLVGSRRRTRS
jgi:multidrug efflux pump